MQLENTFTVPTGIDEAWEAFNDPTRFAPCFPGASVQSYQDDSFVGTVKVKLGPISLTYKGTGTYLERDKGAYRVLIDASGRDARGNGTASAKVTGTLTADGDSRTVVTMVTDMTVTGRPAQFGRGVMADVGEKIIGQFAACLARKLGPDGETGGSASGGSAGKPAASASAGAPASAGAATASTAPLVDGTPAAAPSTNGAAPKLASVPDPVGEVDAIDLLDSVGAPVLKRMVPALLVALVLFMVLRRIKHRHG